MNRKLRRIFRIMQEKIFQRLIILIDFVFSIVFYKIENKDESIKMASIFKFLTTGLLNIADMFKDICCDKSCCTCCSCCSKKKPEEVELDYEIINTEIDNRMKKLRLIKNIKLKLRDETNKNSQDYSETLKKYKIMLKLENDINMIKIN